VQDELSIERRMLREHLQLAVGCALRPATCAKSPLASLKGLDLSPGGRIPEAASRARVHTLASATAGAFSVRPAAVESATHANRSAVSTLARESHSSEVKTERAGYSVQASPTRSGVRLHSISAGVHKVFFVFDRFLSFSKLPYLAGSEVGERRIQG
jgi:hypothetical protein